METVDFKNNYETIKEVIGVLKKSGLVISPSDTVYGVLVDATNESAVKKLIEFKSRPPGKPISIFVSDLEMLKNNVIVDSKQLSILKELLPGPFTVILPSKHKISPLLESEKRTLGVRIPDYSFIADLVKVFKRPITATSANLSGESPHYSVDTLLKGIPKSKKKLIDLIINGGKLPRNKPSAIIDLSTPKIRILRQGDISFADEKTYISSSPLQTKKIAQFILKKFVNKNEKKPLIFILEGELGTGKTIFIKGIGEYFAIKNIVSPSFVIYYEYRINHPQFKKLVHFDLYNIEEQEELSYLRIEKYLKRENILCFEWGEKIGEIVKILKEKGQIIYINIKYLNEKQREIKIKI